MALINGSNFSDILVDTAGDDIVTALAGDDFMYGGLGNDSFNGGEGIDTLDYSLSNQGITLEAKGFIQKASGGIDSFFLVENIVGDADYLNQIDASDGDGGVVTLDVNLSINSLIVNDIPGLGTLNFGVFNFKDVTGTTQADSISGDAQNNTLDGWSGNDYLFGDGGNDLLLGFTGNDTLDGWTGDDDLFGEAGNDLLMGYTGDDLLVGGSGNDKLMGESGNDILNGYGFGAGEVDVLSGGLGADTFLLGDTIGSYYQGAGYAVMTDFDFAEGDKIQVFGSISNYSVSFQSFSGANALDTLIFAGNDLIGVVQDNTDVIPAFDFVTA